MVKYKKTVIAVAVLAVIATALLLLTLRQPEVEFSGPSRISEDSNSLPEGVPDLSKPEDQKAIAELAETNSDQAALKLFAAGANKPIDYHVKLVDQYDEPISGVRVTLYIGQAVPGGGWQRVTATATTSSDGYFYLGDIRGETVKIADVQKEGYIFNHSLKQTMTTTGKSGQPIINTSLESPKIFRGWKIEEVAELKTVSLRHDLIPDNRIYTINLFANEDEATIEEGAKSGDIQISVYKPLDESQFGISNWSFKINFLNAALSEAKAIYSFSAPKENYEIMEIDKGFIRNNHSIWKSRFEDKYFLNYRNGEYYGILSLQIRPTFKKDTVFIYLYYKYNPNGGTNLLSKADIR